MSWLPTEKEHWKLLPPAYSELTEPGESLIHAPGVVSPVITHESHPHRQPTTTAVSMSSFSGQQPNSSAAYGNASRSPTSPCLVYRLPDRIAGPRLSATASASSTTPIHTSCSLFDPLPATFSRLLSTTTAANGLHTTPPVQDVAGTTLPSISTLKLPLPGSSGGAWQDTPADGHSNQRHSRASARHTVSGNNVARGLIRSPFYLNSLPSSAASDMISLSKSMVDLAASSGSAMERQQVENELAMRAEQLHGCLRLETGFMRAHFDFLRTQAQADAETSEVWPLSHEGFGDEIKAAYTIDSQVFAEVSSCPDQHSPEVEQSFADLGEQMHSSFLDYTRGICLLFGSGYDTADHLSRVSKALLYAQMAYEDCVERRTSSTGTAEAVPITEYVDVPESVEDRDDLDMPSRIATAALPLRQRVTRNATVGRDATAGPGTRVTKRKRKRPTRPNFTAAEVAEEKLKFEQQKHDPKGLEAMELKNKQSILHHPPAKSMHPKVDTESHFAANRYQHPSTNSRRGKAKRMPPRRSHRKPIRWSATMSWLEDGSQ